MLLEKGRPENTYNRCENEIKTYDILESLGIEYERADHGAVFTMEECQKVEQILNAKICKNLFLCNRQKTQFYLLMISGEKNFKTKDITGQIGCSRLSFANGEDMKKYLDLTPGSASIMGLEHDRENKVRLLADKDILENEYFCFHPCINTSTVKIKTSDLLSKLIIKLNHELTVVTI